MSLQDWLLKHKHLNNLDSAAVYYLTEKHDIKLKEIDLKETQQERKYFPVVEIRAHISPLPNKKVMDGWWEFK